MLRWKMRKKNKFLNRNPKLRKAADQREIEISNKSLELEIKIFKNLNVFSY